MSVYYNGNEVSEIVYGTGDTGKLNFKAIGYSDVPEPLKDGLEYAKEIQENWDEKKDISWAFRYNKRLRFFPEVDFSTVKNTQTYFNDCSNLITVGNINTTQKNLRQFFDGCSSLTYITQFDTSNGTDLYGCFQNCSSLTSIPQLDTSKVTNMGYCFRYCSSLTSIPELDTANVTTMYGCFDGCSSLTKIPELDTSKVTDMSYCFQNCSSLTSIPQLDTANVTNMSYCFSGCSSLTEIPELNTSNVTNFTRFVDINGGKNLKRINGLSFKSMPSFTNTGLITYYTNESCRYVLIKDIGTNSACTKLVIKELRCWGIDSEEVPDARQSLIDSLLNYSYDRRAAGYSDCTIQLYKDVKAVLSQEEIDAIQAKGYIIS